MTAARHAGYAATAWSLPAVVWIAGALVSEAGQAGDAARAALRTAPLLPALQMLAVALLLPALAWRSDWQRTAGIAAVIVLAPWPVGALLVQTAGVGWFGLGIGQLVVAIWAALATALVRIVATGGAADDLRRPITQAALLVAGIAVARTIAPTLNDMVAM